MESTPKTTPTVSVTSVQEGSIIRPRPRSSISRKSNVAAGGIAAPPGNENISSEGDAKESGELPTAKARLASTSSAISIDDEDGKKKEFRYSIHI